MRHEEVMEAEEDMDDEAEDEEGDKLYAIIVINLDILLGIARIPILHVDIVMKPTMLVKIVLNCWLRCRKEENQQINLMFRRYLWRKGLTTQEYRQ